MWDGRAPGSARRAPSRSRRNRARPGPIYGRRWRARCTGGTEETTGCRGSRRPATSRRRVRARPWTAGWPWCRSRRARLRPFGCRARLLSSGKALGCAGEYLHPKNRKSCVATECSMEALLLRSPAPLAAKPSPLELTEVPTPVPGPGQIRVRVRACGVCHTDLHIVEGDITPPVLPVVVGHQVVGTVDA